MIHLEKIDAVLAATGADYATVRQALLTTDGDVAAAIRLIMNQEHAQSKPHEEAKEEEADKRQHFKYQEEIDDIVAVIKDIWRTGNASSLIVEKNGHTVLNLSLTVSAFILIITPLISLIGLGTAIIGEYTIKIQMVNGEIIDIMEYSLKHRAARNRQGNDDPEQRNPQGNDEQEQ